MMRAAEVETTWPGRTAPMLARGLPRLAWLRTLNISQRYWSSRRLAKRDPLKMEKSRLKVPKAAGLK